MRGRHLPLLPFILPASPRESQKAALGLGEGRQITAKAEAASRGPEVLPSAAWQEEACSLFQFTGARF